MEALDSYTLHTTEWLDHDERIVLPALFRKTPWLYYDVRFCILVQPSGNPKAGPFIIEDKWWDPTSEQYEYRGMVLLCRLHSGSKNDLITTGFAVTQEEYEKDRDRYKVIETYVQVRFADEPGNIVTLPAEAHRAMTATPSQVVGVTHFVSPKEW